MGGIKMNSNEWKNLYGNPYLVTLTDEERRYLALAPISPDWEVRKYYSKTNVWYTGLTAFFDGDVIVKVITETRRFLDNGVENCGRHSEYDTHLETSNRELLLPLTSRGKPKKLSASNIDTVMAFGCQFGISFQLNSDSSLGLSNPRANKWFPIGEYDKTALIRSDEDFHDFMNYYISTCREDYFDKLEAFKNAEKVTVKYKTGDVFRMELDRNRYCYGIITGEIRRLHKMPELPEKHSLRSLMMVPIMVRYYNLITDDPNLTAHDLERLPLGRVDICGDNDIIWGTHTIVDHKELTEEDLEFNFICTKIVTRSPHFTLFSQDMLIRDGIMPKKEYTLYIEWGFAQIELGYDKLSDKLKAFLENYSSPHGGVGMGIHPAYAVPDEKIRQYENYKNNLLNPENRDFLNEIFACLGLDPDTDFDTFAVKFGGLTKSEILKRM